MKRFICLLLSCVMLLGLFATTASAAKVTKVNLTVTEPAVGAVKKSATATLPSTASTEVVSIAWSGKDETFTQGSNYTVAVRVKIKASSSNTFGALQNIKATINGKEAQAIALTDGVLTVQYTWTQVGGPAADNSPEGQLKTKLAALAASYVASNGTTADDLVSFVKAQLPGAEVWKAGGTYALRTKLPTETADGFVSANIGVTYNGVTVESYAFTAPIPALNKSPEQTNLAADKALMQAAFNAFTPTSQTTADQILAAVNAAAKHGTKAVWSTNCQYTAPTASSNGAIRGDLLLTLGASKDTIKNLNKVLPAVGESAEALLSKDILAVSGALSKYAASNSTTQDILVSVAKAAIQNGSELTVVSFEVKPATFDEDGRVNLHCTLTLKGETKEQRFSLVIPKTRGDVPKDISVTSYEFEVLRLSNIERFKNGAMPLTMAAPLQNAADIREKEIVEAFNEDHTRPDGSSCFTAIDSAFAANRHMGENMAKYLGTPAAVVEAWMNSPGHRANILNKDYGLFGCGENGTGTHKYWVQIFANGGAVSSAASSTGRLVFSSVEEMEKAYLICDTADGTTYVPLDAEYMTKNGSKYTLSLKGCTVTATVVPGFVDVPADSYYAESVAWAVDSGVTTGTSAATFSPAATCTRGQVVTFLWRALGKPEPKNTNNPFTDVKATDYFYKPVLWAVENGITNGTGAATFSPNATCTSGQVVTFLYRSNNPDAAKEASNPYYANAVKWAEGKSLLSGTAVAFAPANNAPRSDIVYYLFRNSK